MRFLKFEIKNYKGIKHTTLDLAKAPTANVVTLVGLNESGKTTILEALNDFSPDKEGIEALYNDKASHQEPEALVPKSEKGNFNDEISITATLEPNESDVSEVCRRLKLSLRKISTSIEYRKPSRFRGSSIFLIPNIKTPRQFGA